MWTLGLCLSPPLPLFPHLLSVWDENRKGIQVKSILKWGSREERKSEYTCDMEAKGGLWRGISKKETREMGVDSEEGRWPIEKYVTVHELKCHDFGQPDNFRMLLTLG